MTVRGRFPFLLTLLATACIFYGSPALAQSITDFGLYDQEGHFYQISRLDSELVLLIIQQHEDATSQTTLTEATSLRHRFQDKSVFVAMVNADTDVSRESIRDEMVASGVNLPVFLDSAQVVSASLGATRSGEAFLIDARRLSLLYRGPLSEAALTDSMEAALSGNPITAAIPYTGGELIDFTYRKELESRGVSYQTDIAPVLIDRCAGCHREGGLAPWPMTSHRMLQGWSPMIREVLLTRRMPPGQIDEAVGSWTNTHQLTDAEMALLVHWIDNGARKEGEGDPIADLPHVSPDWPLGEPDLIVNLPEQEVPATGIVDFVYERVAIPLTEDSWVEAVSYWPGDTSVLHSVLVYAIDHQSPPLDPFALISAEDTEFFSLFVPGETTDVFLPGSGFLLSKGSDLVVKIRYLSSGRATTDRTKIGLHFLTSTPEVALKTLTLEDADFTIPAGESKSIEVISPPFETDVLVEAFAPQMHGRGTGMSITALYPDGHEQQLISVPHYNFNWQMNYMLLEPIRLPAGSRLLSVSTFDNSELNPFSLTPEKDAVVGPTSWDEILNHYVRTYMENQ